MSTIQQLRDLPGLGAKTAAQLAAARIYTPVDLLHIAPEFLNSSETDWAPGQQIQCRARVLSVRLQFIRRRGAMLTVSLQTAQERPLQARFFNAAYLKKQFQAGDWYVFSGRLDKKRGDTLVMPSYTALPDEGQTAARVYNRRPDGIGASRLRKWIDFLLNEMNTIADPLDELSDTDYYQCIYDLHNCDDQQRFDAVSRILALRACASLLWQLRQLQQQRQQLSACSLKLNEQQHQDLLAALPFSLSTHQKQAWQELVPYLLQDHPSMQLIQGEVGCGKTILAFMAIWAALCNDTDAVFMAPTQMLARQQYDYVSRLLADSPFACHLVTADHNESTRKRPVPQCLIGTHALLNQTDIAKTGLIIIDEQQKFGVSQRQQLIQRFSAASHPHVIMLSATPIPRTLARCLYGDMQLITVRGRPQQHGQISSFLQQQSTIADIRELIQEHYTKQGLVLCICPYLESDHQSVINARALYQDISRQFPAGAVALAHGSLTAAEQEVLYNQLNNNEVRILISTSVIEIGFNARHAHCMIVCNSERFGLAQLHQMRGRLARDSNDGQCYFCSPDPERHQRLNTVIECEDGFAIAEADLALRGSGELLGQQQHGIAQFYCGPTNIDCDILELAAATIAAWTCAPGRQLFTPSA